MWSRTKSELYNTCCCLKILDSELLWVILLPVAWCKWEFYSLSVWNSNKMEATNLVAFMILLFWKIWFVWNQPNLFRTMYSAGMCIHPNNNFYTFLMFFMSGSVLQITRSLPSVVSRSFKVFKKWLFSECIILLSFSVEWNELISFKMWWTFYLDFTICIPKQWYKMMF